MKISIVLPVYNGEETLNECLEAILNIEYPKSDYELVVVNDCSTDDSREIMEEFLVRFREEGVDIKIIDFDVNKGRIEARLEGVKNAKYENLLFIDHRCIADTDILKVIKERGYEPIVGNPYQNRKGSLINRFFFVFRKILYGKYWGYEYPDVYIDKSNFDIIPKGFSPFFCKKERFLKSLPKDTGKWVSDDTLIFSNMVKNGVTILKNSKVRVYYSERNEFGDFFYHTYQRGPRFVDYYKDSKRKYFLIIPAILFLPLLLLFLIVFLWDWLLYVCSFMFLLAFIYLILIKSFSLIDFIAVILIGPLVLLSFGTGVYKGVFRLLFKKNK